MRDMLNVERKGVPIILTETETRKLYNDTEVKQCHKTNTG